MTAHKTPTVGDVLCAREAAGCALRLWRCSDAEWIGEDEDRTLWIWPAEADGWGERRPCPTTRTDMMTEAPPSMALGTGWPGLAPIADGSR
jgi:hypothetical protein